MGEQKKDSMSDNINIPPSPLPGFPNHNILIGYNAGIELVDESYRLIVKGNGVNIDATMTEREYYLISGVIKVLEEYRSHKNDIIIAQNNHTDYDKH